jgi:hypothetical protein
MSQKGKEQSPQGELFIGNEIRDVVLDILASHQQPSAWDLLGILEGRLGWKSRWRIKGVLQEMTNAPTPKVAWRSYLESLTTSGDLDEALAGGEAPKKEIISTIDRLLQQSKAYGDTKQFQEMISFMARFRDYAPYNNMLVRVQNPTCSFYATQTDWGCRFERKLKEDARPMLIPCSDASGDAGLRFGLDRRSKSTNRIERLCSFSGHLGSWLVAAHRP